MTLRVKNAVRANSEEPIPEVNESSNTLPLCREQWVSACFFVYQHGHRYGFMTKIFSKLGRYSSFYNYFCENFIE